MMNRVKCWAQASQETDKSRECPGIELNSQSAEVVEKFRYSGDTVAARGDAVDNDLARKGIDEVPQSRGWIIFCFFVRSFMLYGSETWPVKKDHAIRLE